MSYRIVTLYSGSGGNSTLICANGTKILIDAGKSARALCSALRSVGCDISEIRAIFITHEHCDHVSALETLAKNNRIPIHITEQSAQKLLRIPSPELHSAIVSHSPLFCEEVDGLSVRSFCTPHDSNMSVGYRIEFSDADGLHAIGYATDVGYVSDGVKASLIGCEAVVLEANHDPDMLSCGPYPYTLKTRIRSRRGHLSNGECATLACELVAHGAKGFILAHLSEENNDPTLALDEVSCAVSDPTVRICVASPRMPTELDLPTSAEVTQ